MNWAEFLSMGGYGLYVWTSYLAAAIVLLLNVWIPLRRNQSARRALQEFYRARKDSE